jgi:hypothetical protein
MKQRRQCRRTVSSLCLRGGLSYRAACALFVLLCYHYILVTPLGTAAVPTKPNSRARLLKEPMSLYVQPEQATALRALSKRSRVPMQVYLREGVDLILARYKKELRR